MKIVFAFALLAISLNAEEGREMDSKISAIPLEKIEQSDDYSEIEFLAEGVSVGILEEEDLTGTFEILDENKLELQPVSSLDGEIEKETAKILHTTLTTEEVDKELTPQLEDLAQLAQKPSETLSQLPDKELNGYESLPISVEEKQKIAKILTTMAENNVFGLLFERKYLERLGHDIRHVHPLRFIGTVFNDPRLVHCMHRIRRSTFKWDGFIDGFTERFKEEIKSGNINAYIPGLAQSLDLKAEDLQAYVNFGDFEGMVVFLLEKSRR